jgi:LysR family glycine cleavage system transcriptional activator
MVCRLPSLNALRTFEAAARHRSFKLAAEELSVTPTAVSHQIKGLEQFLGVALFNRLTRALELTSVGEAMLPKVREGMGCFVAAVERSREHATAGRLIVSAPPSFAARWLVPRLQRFTQAQPQLGLHLLSSIDAIDTDEHVAPMPLEGIDAREEDSHISIRFGIGAYRGFSVDRIFAPDYIAVCSPKLLNGPHPLSDPSDIRFHTLIHDDTITNERARPSWEEWLRLAGVAGVDATAGPHFSDSGLALFAAVDGLGLALASKPLVAAELADGRLLAPFDFAVEQCYAYYLVIPEAVAERPAVAAFRAWLRAEIALDG